MTSSGRRRLAELAEDSVVLGDTDTERHQSRGFRYLAVCADDGTPTGVYRIDEGPPPLPVAVLDGRLTLAALVRSDALTLLDLNPYGALVAQANRVSGMLESTVVDTYLSTTPDIAGDTRGEPVDSSDGVLAGAIRTGRALVVCAKKRCGYPNSLTFYDPDRPPVCANPHHARHALAITRR